MASSLAIELCLLGGDAQHHVAPHIGAFVKLGFLRRVADGRALGGPLTSPLKSLSIPAMMRKSVDFPRR
ncbi:MAG: hypothetical protein R3D84_04205 [Paracoccaceae bacterium]